jgi:hypothetical protein
MVHLPAGGIFQRTGVRTKHFRLAELQATLREHGFGSMIRAERVEYSWDTEVRRPPKARTKHGTGLGHGPCLASTSHMRALTLTRYLRASQFEPPTRFLDKDRSLRRPFDWLIVAQRSGEPSSDRGTHASLSTSASEASVGQRPRPYTAAPSASVGQRPRPHTASAHHAWGARVPPPVDLAALASPPNRQASAQTKPGARGTLTPPSYRQPPTPLQKRVTSPTSLGHGSIAPIAVAVTRLSGSSVGRACSVSGPTATRRQPWIMSF